MPLPNYAAPQPLDAEQLARAAALNEARDLLASTVLEDEPISPIDLVALARYIEVGGDPWTAEQPPGPREHVIEMTFGSPRELASEVARIVRVHRGQAVIGTGGSAVEAAQLNLADAQEQLNAVMADGNSTAPHLHVAHNATGTPESVVDPTEMPEDDGPLLTPAT